MYRVLWVQHQGPDDWNWAIRTNHSRHAATMGSAPIDLGKKQLSGERDTESSWILVGLEPETGHAKFMQEHPKPGEIPHIPKR